MKKERLLLTVLFDIKTQEELNLAILQSCTAPIVHHVRLRNLAQDEYSMQIYSGISFPAQGN
ncbi:MAG: hypothetical protein R2779_07210 [Crocinitomicaceae bacterium]